MSIRAPLLSIELLQLVLIGWALTICCYESVQQNKICNLNKLDVLLTLFVNRMLKNCLKGFRVRLIHFIPTEMPIY